MLQWHSAGPIEPTIVNKEERSKKMILSIERPWITLINIQTRLQYPYGETKAIEQ
jgi:hypothetical protein